jgi:bifunctional UDP-N-acetylglucosamine pyrophosphorylase / glucosamine-1-phosphate N-acetyltransferase
MGVHERKELLAVILAAGKGTRMNSSLPKVLHRLRGRPLISYAVGLARAFAPSRILVVVGHRADLVRSALDGGNDLGFVVQEPQSGTGHALACCLPAIDGFAGTVLVLSGDVPGLGQEAIRGLLDARSAPGESPGGAAAPVALLTALLPDPRGYGRVLRDPDGRVAAIREQKDLAPGEEAVREANMGVYLFDADFLRREVPRLSSANAQKEYYLTDLVAAAAARGTPAAAWRLDDPGEAMGINTMAELSALEERMRSAHLTALMEAGVRVIDPAATYVDDTVRVEADAVLHPSVFLYGETVVGRGAVIHPGCVVTDSRIGEGCEVRPHSVIAGSVLEKGAVVGPFAHLRPGTVLREGAKVGNFVEVKKSTFGAGSKASHLTYVGDAIVGERVNIGAGTVTCNYDGWTKHRTVIEDGVFIGSGTMLVAPVTVGKGAIVGAGSTITRDVPADALAVARAPQENKDGWAARKRRGKEKRG